MRHQFRATRRGQESRRRDMDSYSVICDRTGFRAQASDCVMQWNGLFVIAKYAEQRNEQERIDVPRESVTAPIVRPRTTSPEVVKGPPNWDIP